MESENRNRTFHFHARVSGQRSSAAPPLAEMTERSLAVFHRAVAPSGRVEDVAPT